VPHDVIVIGAGIIGCAIARALGRRGVSVRVFEARTIGAGATHASAGVLAPYIEAHDRGPLLDLTVRSLALYDAFVASAASESGIAVEYRRCGTLEVATDAAAAATLAGVAQHQTGVARWLDGDAARREEPGLPASIEGALHVAAHGYVAVPALMDALVWSALRDGVQFETADRVAAIQRDGDSLRVVTSNGHMWQAAQVVVAAGSWSPQISAVELEPDDVRPIRGQLLQLRWPGPLLTHVIWGPDCYVVPWENGTVLVGATVEDVGFDARTTAAGVRDLLDAVCGLLPDAWRSTFVEARVGLRPASRDGLPVIGRSAASPSVVYATGHYRNGILLAPLTAQLVADLVVDGIEDPSLHALRPGR
jgi:glycine oxidase